ncbi:hypothetical protein KKG66_00210 [bacterium]|nr:hypothetical protein [bacterium]
MKKILFALLLLAVSLSAYSDRPRVVVEVSDSLKNQNKSAFEYTPPTDSTGPRVSIDAGELIYQMRVDSINKWAEEKIREQIVKVERHFEDPKVEEETGKIIGGIIMEQQMALLDLQVERALSFRDTLLLYGLKTALQEMVLKNPDVQDELMRLLDKVEREYKKYTMTR